jgi:hypothetical protein
LIGLGRGFTPHGRPLTFLGTLGGDRPVTSRVFDAPIDGQCFLAYIEQQ